ncbi:MAG: formylglycine-generating enzyme family protein [Anaerolineales bacterium]
MPRKLTPSLLILIIMFFSLASCQKTPERIVDKTGATMALVPSGAFEMTRWDEMENEKTTDSVYVDDVYLDIYEVTNQQYAACVQAGACTEPLNTTEYTVEAYRDHPVIFVTWDMAHAYCRWRGARLPTRAEWEKAAAGELEEVTYYWGDVSPICQVGSRMGSGIRPDAKIALTTEPVGSSPPNAYGLYEMTGGMWEWVQDEHPSDAYANPPEVVSFLRIYRTGGYGPLYERFLCSFRCARSP